MFSLVPRPPASYSRIPDSQTHTHTHTTLFGFKQPIPFSLNSLYSLQSLYLFTLSLQGADKRGPCKKALLGHALYLNDELMRAR